MAVSYPAGTDEQAPDRPDAGARAWVYIIAVAVSPVVLGAVTLLMLVLAIVGSDPVWAVGQMTLAEAAATRDRGGVVRMIGEGMDPNGRYAVRLEVLASVALDVTPIEAAALSRTDYMVELLVHHGATLGDRERHRLMCFHYRRGSEDIYQYLAGFAPTEPPIDCTPHEPYW